MTETTGPISTMLIGAEARRRGSVGQLAPSTECKIVDLATGEAARAGRARRDPGARPAGHERVPEQPEATAATIEPDGWLHTGDVGYADADGYLYIVDRVKEIIKYNAYQVAPAELEAVLGTHPAVVDAAVVPSPDAEAGEIPKAFVVLRTPATSSDATARHGGRPDGVRGGAGRAVQEGPRGRRSSTRFPDRPRARSCGGCSWSVSGQRGTRPDSVCADAAHLSCPGACGGNCVDPDDERSLLRGFLARRGARHQPADDHRGRHRQLRGPLRRLQPAAHRRGLRPVDAVRRADRPRDAGGRPSGPGWSIRPAGSPATTLALLEITRKFVGAVKPGDTVHVAMDVASARESSRGDRGVVTFNTRIVNQRDETVIEGQEVVMLRRRPSAE